MREKFIEYVAASEKLAAQIAALVPDCENVPRYPQKNGSRWYGDHGGAARKLKDAAREIRVDALRRAVQDWAGMTHPTYPPDRLERLVDARDYRRTDELLKDVVASAKHLMDQIDQEAEEVINEDAKNLLGWAVPRSRPLYKGNGVLQLHIGLTNDYVRERELRTVGAVARLVEEIHGDPSAFYTWAVKWIEKGRPSERQPIVGGPIKAFRAYKNGHTLIWLESDDLARQVAEKMHPRLPRDGEHHHWLEPDGNYRACGTCGMRKRHNTINSLVVADNPAKQQSIKTHYPHGYRYGQRKVPTAYLKAQHSRRNERGDRWMVEQYVSSPALPGKRPMTWEDITNGQQASELG